MPKRDRRNDRATPIQRARLRSLGATLAANADGVTIVDHAGHLVFANEAGQQMAQRLPSQEHPIPEQIAAFSLRYPDGRAVPPEETPLSRALRGEAVVEEVLVFARPDGRDTYTSNTAGPVRDNQDRIAGAYAIFRDVTQARQADEALRQLSMQTVSILESISDAFFALDDNLVVIYFNKAAEELLGRKAEDVVGRQLFEAFPEARGSIFEEMCTRAAREPLLILSSDLHVKRANRSFYQTFHVSPEETEGRFVYELGKGQWDIPRLRELLGEILAKNTRFEGFEVVCAFPQIGHRTMLLNARRLTREGEGELLILLALEDITELALLWRRTAGASGSRAKKARGRPLVSRCRWRKYPPELQAPAALSSSNPFTTVIHWLRTEQGDSMGTPSKRASLPVCPLLSAKRDNNGR